MSIYKSSTLAMIPTAYKDGKLYSVRPTDGSGDFTFSRGTTATRVASSGYIEKGRENLLLQSNAFDTTWVASNGATISSGEAGYDGTNDAWLLTKSTNNFSNINQSVSASGVNTYSVYAKGTSTNFCLRDNVSGTRLEVNLNDGSIALQQSGIIVANVQDVGGGWYRVSATFNETLSVVQIYPKFNSADVVSVTIQDAQLEAGLVATDYIETTTTSVSAGILEDMPRLDYSGSCPSLLLEPQRSNLITHSELLTDSSWTNQLGSTIDVGQASSVSGYNDAWKLNKASGTFKSLRLQKTLASDNYSLTWFLKAGTISIAEFRFDGGLGAQFIDFDLSNGTHGTNANLSNIEMTPFNDGWYRCSASINTNLTNVHLYVDDASVSSGAGYIYAQYPQLEAGSYPTSYIPTYGASVTRSYDTFKVTGISDLIDTQGGVMLLETQALDRNQGYSGVSLSDDTFTNNAQIRYGSATDQVQVQYRVGSSNECLASNSENDITNNLKIAFKYEADSFKMFVNGVLEATDTSGSVNAANTFDTIKSDRGDGGDKYLGRIKQLVVFPTALTDSECIALTTL